MYWILSLVALLVSYSSFAHNLSDSEVQAVVTRFAPLVKLHHDEIYLPSSVEWYLQKSQLVQSIDGVDTVLGERLNSRQISQYQGSSFMITPIRNRNQQEETYRGMPLVNGLSQAPCYVNLKQTQDELILQYLFFYPYNGRQLGVFDWLSSITPFDLGAHEGDWEHIGVHLKIPNFWLSLRTRNAEALVVSRLYYSRHTQNFGIYIEPSEAEVAEGTHPIVYSAYHGHASYPHSFEGINHLLDRTSGDGPLWKCWENIIYTGDMDQPKPGQEWIQFGGQWGTGGAPKTPTFQGWWENQ